MCRPPAGSARWLLIDGGVDEKDMRVRVRTRSCGLAALGYWSYVARSVRGVGVPRTLLSLSSTFVCVDVFLVRGYSLVPRPTYHRREFVITAEHSDSDCHT